MPGSGATPPHIGQGRHIGAEKAHQNLYPRPAATRPAAMATAGGNDRHDPFLPFRASRRYIRAARA